METDWTENAADGPVVEGKVPGFQQKYIPLELPGPKQHKNLQKKIRRKQYKQALHDVELVDSTGVIYLSHIPHGFYEEQMRDYFSQFGDVNRMCLVRSKKSGRSRGFAFIEFEYEEVAKIVAETMDNYLMFNHILKCEFVPKSQVKETWFIEQDENNRKELQLISRREANTFRTCVEMEMLNKRRYNKLKALEEKLQTMGVKYKYPGEIPKAIKDFDESKVDLKKHLKKTLGVTKRKKIQRGIDGQLKRRLSINMYKHALKLDTRRKLAAQGGLTPGLKRSIHKGMQYLANAKPQKFNVSPTK